MNSSVPNQSPIGNESAPNAGSLGWPFPMLKYKHIFEIKYTEAILSNSTQKLLRFEITEMPIEVKKINLLCYLLQFLAHFRSLRLESYIVLVQRMANTVHGFNSTGFGLGSPAVNTVNTDAMDERGCKQSK